MKMLVISFTWHVPTQGFVFHPLLQGKINLITWTALSTPNHLVLAFCLFWDIKWHSLSDICVL